MERRRSGYGANKSPAMKKNYTWVITKDNVVGDVSEAVGRIGPSGAADRLPFDVVIQQGERFRLLHADGRVEFYGYIHGEYAGNEPLDDYGRQYNCTDIEYQVGDEWVTLDGSVRRPT